MPVLILCAMTASALESPDISADELDAPVRSIGWLMVATLAFALVPVQDGDTKEWSLGVLQNPGQYVAVLSFGIGGLILYRLLCRRWRGSQAFARRMTAVVLAFACAFSMVHIGIGKFGQWHTDSDLVEQYTSAIKLKDDLPEGDWRVDTYKTHDNLGLWLDKSSLQYFGSTAAPSILSFYPALGASGMSAVSRTSPTTPAGSAERQVPHHHARKAGRFPRRCGRRMELLRHQRRLHAL